MKNKFLSILLVLAMLCSFVTMFAVQATASTHPFTDVPSWADEYVAKVYEKGIMQGTGGAIFSPDMPLSREQLVVTLYRMSGSNVVGTLDTLKSCFADAEDISNWAYNAVEWARAENITAGIEINGELCFKPGNTVTRQEAAKFFVTYIDYMKLDAPTDNVANLKDMDTVAPWALSYVERCIAAGIINGDGNGNFDPTGSTSRVAAAKMLACLPEKQEIIDPPNPDDDPSEDEPTVEVNTDKRVNIDPVDPSPSSIIGSVDLSEYTIEEGLEISNAVLVGESKTNAGQLSATGNAIHGWHESRIARTEYGTYIVYANDEWLDSSNLTGNHGYVRAWSQFILVKVTESGFKVVLKGKYRCHAGSCASNVLVGEDGIVYVTTFAIGSIGGGESAPMDVYVFDTKTDKLVNESHVNKPFKLQDISRTHGFGYYQPIYDPSNGKIYALYAGGEWPGFYTWFIYDIATNKWHDECYLIETPYRASYMHAYPDGKGGIFFVAQRNAPSWGVESSYGGAVKFAQGGYLFDGLYLFIIPDMTKEDYRLDEIYIPDYTDKTAFPPTPSGAVLSANAAHYTGGTSYLDSRGHLYVIYSENNYKKYVVYDTKNNFTKIRANKELLLTVRSGGEYQFAMAENTAGEVYLIAINASSIDSKLEIYKMDIKASRINIPVIKNSKGQAATVSVPVNGMGRKLGHARVAFTGTRNNSVQDNTLSLVTWSGEAPRKLTLANQDIKRIGTLIYSGGFETYNYFYYSIKLPD